MRKTVKVSWVFWISIRRCHTNYHPKTRGSNFFELTWHRFRVSFGMPWHHSVVEYDVLNSYGRQVEGIEKINKEILAAPGGFKLRMPKRKYVLQ